MTAPGGWLARWRADRALTRNALRFVRTLQSEPDPADVQWLADHVTRGDIDHARWELRYARRALGLLTAERDALDDRTASAVARGLAESLGSDPHIAADKRSVAERQLNARLLAYRTALAERTPGMPTSERLVAVLWKFSASGRMLSGEESAHLGELLSRYLTEANVKLREIFGAAELPEDVKPSTLITGQTKSVPRAS